MLLIASLFQDLHVMQLHRSSSSRLMEATHRTSEKKTRDFT